MSCIARPRSGLRRALALAPLLMLLACGRSEDGALPGFKLPQTAPGIESLQGEWYNTETTVYPDPSIAVVKFHPAGGIVMTGLDDSAQYGQYQLAADGRLTIRLAVRNRASLTVRDSETEIAAARTQLLDYPARVIFDAVPVLREGRLELQTPEKLLVFSRDTADRARVIAATQAFQQAHEEALKAEAERQRLLAEQRRRENLKRVRSVLGVKTVLPKIGGAGARPCGSAVLRELRRVGWRVVGDAEQADAILEVQLSGIEYKYSAWIGRYYKMRYTTRVRRAADGHVLAAFDGVERAAGRGPQETCTDTADDIVDDIEERIDDLRD